MSFKISIITPKNNSDYLVSDIIDGIVDLQSSGVAIEFRFLEGYPHHFGEEVNSCMLSKSDFIQYAQTCDLIFLGYRYKDDNNALAYQIDRWDKTVFVDGSEGKHDNRSDVGIQYKILKDKYDGPGKIQSEMLSKCALYLRREKPYINGIIPFPFGIQRRYRAYQNTTKKDIDFICIFGQDAYPQLRAYVKKVLETFCLQNGFSFATSQTKGFGYDAKKIAGRDDFYSLLARAKVGVSVGGGGFDTLRFWETLANNCLLITERIDIFPPNSSNLVYKRIYQCNNLYDFLFYFEKLGNFLRDGYKLENLQLEYTDILEKHSTKQRIIDVLKEVYKKGIISHLPKGLT